MGKDSARRPAAVTESTAEANWAQTFPPRVSLPAVDSETCQHSHTVLEMYAEPHSGRMGEIPQFHCARCGARVR